MSALKIVAGVILAIGCIIAYDWLRDQVRRTDIR
jgi:hypothetical protein